MKRIAALFSLLILGTTAAAQNLPVEDQLLNEMPVVRRYTVELIVFAYTEDVSVGTELFPADEPVVVEDELLTIDEEALLAGEFVSNVERPLPDDSNPGGDDDSLTELQGEEGLEHELPFILLAEEEFTMVDIIEKFELLDAYETQLHVAWTQPTYPAEDTLPIELHALGAVPPGLNGSFTLYLSRYLHLVVDLALDASAAEEDTFEQADEPAFSFGDPRQQDELFIYGADGDIVTGTVRYRLQENRIVKNGEMRYFDHPKFGVVAKVTRIEEEPEKEEQESLQESRQLPGISGQ